MREPARDLRLPAAAASPHRRALRGTDAPGRGEPVARRRCRLHGQGRHVPHGVPLPPDAADVHGGPPGGPVPDGGHPVGDAQHPTGVPVGPLPAEPRRADARDGHRRRAGLHVPRLRPGSSGQGQRRHPPPAGAAARQRPQPHRDDERLSSSPCRGRRSSTTATRSGWATTSTWATATRCARPCSGTATATPASPMPTPSASTCRSSSTPSTTRKPSTSRRRRTTPTRCCGG